ncbi:MAG: transposase, partial [Betaproteobacteria bacterium]
MLAPVKGTSPLTRRWPSATLDRRCAPLPVKFAGRDGGMVSGRTNVSTVVASLPSATNRTAAHLPNANITFDKFHAVKIINDAVDLVRRAEQKDRPELKKTRYIWLKNKCNLPEAQLAALGGLTDLNLKTARAYQIRLTFQDLYAQPSREAAEAFLRKWYFWATHSRLAPVIEAAGTIKRHWDGILRWFDNKIANGILEGINSLVCVNRSKSAADFAPKRQLISLQSGTSFRRFRHQHPQAASLL